MVRLSFALNFGQTWAKKSVRALIPMMISVAKVAIVKYFCKTSLVYELMNQ
jgi:hypothetical protein